MVLLIDVMHSGEALPERRGARCDRFGIVRAQAFRDQCGQGRNIIDRHPAADEFGRADAKAVGVAFDSGDRQSDAAGEEARFAELPRGCLTAAECGCLKRELVAAWRRGMWRRPAALARATRVTSACATSIIAGA